MNSEGQVATQTLSVLVAPVPFLAPIPSVTVTQNTAATFIFEGMHVNRVLDVLCNLLIRERPPFRLILP